MGNEKILLIDSFGLLFRSYFALEKTQLSTKAGVPTFAIYGFFRALFKAIQEIQPTQIIFAMESTSSWRKELDPNYKANRKEQPALLLEQIKLFIEVLKDSKLPHWDLEGCEADDVLSALTVFFQKDPHTEVYIYSADKDLTQLVQDRVWILKPGRILSNPLDILGASEVHAKFGVWPSQIGDYLAIVGDTSDNIKGVLGVGPKTASRLLEEYRSLEGIYENLEKLPLTLKKKFEESREQVKLSRKLVSLHQNCDFVKDKNMGVWDIDHAKRLEGIFERLEFSLEKELQILKKMLKNSSSEEISLFDLVEDKKNLSAASRGTDPSFSEQNVQYHLVTQKSELQNLAKEVKSRRFFSVDTETTDLSFEKADLLGVSICLKAHEAFYIPLSHPQVSGVSLQEFQDLWSDIFSDPDIKKIGHNLKYDYQILRKVFPNIRGVFFDTMIAAYLCRPDGKRYNLDEMSLLYCQYRKISYKDLVDGKNFPNLQTVDIQKVKNYACEDADMTYQLYEILDKNLQKEELQTIFSQIEMPLIPILANMEKLGIGVNIPYLLDLKQDFQQRLGLLQEELYSLVGVEFNVNSPKQISQILYERLKFSVPKIKGKRQTAFSTDEETLQELKDFPFVQKLLEYRKYHKLLSTYVLSLMEKAVSNTEGGIPRIHTSFHQTGTATGRLSSSEPNLQNIPIREEAGKLVRKGFIPKAGYSLVSLDYSQIELRLMAHFSEDSFLIQAFENGEDIHVATASKIFSKPPSEIASQERGIAKTINFGIIYGMGALKLAKEIRVTPKEAKEFIDTYFQMFRGVREFIQKTKEQAHKQGFVQTILGRKRFFPDINTDNAMLVSMNERMAVNTVIQGSNADLMKKCMIEWAAREEFQEAALLLQIHDELLFEIPEKSAQKFGEKIGEFMESIYFLRVPLKVSLNIGSNWGDMKS